MLIFLLIFLLISNAVTLRQDKSILFSRVVIQNLIFASFIAFNNLYVKPLENGISIYGDLFNVSVLSQIFSIFIFIIGGTILWFTGFRPKKVYTLQYYPLYVLILSKFTYNNMLFIITLSIASLSIKLPLKTIINIVITIFNNGTNDFIYLCLITLTSCILITITSLVRNSVMPSFIQYFFASIASIAVCMVFTYIPEEWFNIVSLFNPSIIKSLLESISVNGLAIVLCEVIIPCEFTMTLPINYAMEPGDRGPSYSGQAGSSSLAPIGSDDVNQEVNSTNFLHLQEKVKANRHNFHGSLRQLKAAYNDYLESNAESINKAGSRVANIYSTAEINRNKMLTAIEQARNTLSPQAREFIYTKLSFADLGNITTEQSALIEHAKIIKSVDEEVKNRK